MKNERINIEVPIQKIRTALRKVLIKKGINLDWPEYRTIHLFVVATIDLRRKYKQ